MIKFSVIIPSYLGFYPGVARDREQKILRAIASVQHQSFKNFEIIVVADGCQKTMELVRDCAGVRSFLIDRGKQFGGGPRNKGIEEARGEWIVYLDIDDMWGTEHLKTIAENLNGYDWVYFNDIHFNSRTGKWFEMPCDVSTKGRHGTSNIAHKRLGVTWNARGYAHDFYFVQELKKFKNFGKIPTPEYYVMHIPGTRNSGGYDL